jgi:hypothetical protein
MILIKHLDKWILEPKLNYLKSKINKIKSIKNTIPPKEKLKANHPSNLNFCSNSINKVLVKEESLWILNKSKLILLIILSLSTSSVLKKIIYHNLQLSIHHDLC